MTFAGPSIPSCIPDLRGELVNQDITMSDEHDRPADLTQQLRAMVKLTLIQCWVMLTKKHRSWNIILTW
jgi:hypothetical protein